MSNQKNLFVFYENCKFIFFHYNDFFLLLKICILKSLRLIRSVSSKCLSPSSFFHHLIFHIYSSFIVVALVWGSNSTTQKYLNDGKFSKAGFSGVDNPCFDVFF